ncbi:MAG: YdbL family protein [Steroidobacteraceae bacterium]|jgi:uncharacterized protein YdbL (DUF1318 family)|nr:DUF1318 domain-containing protein [Gammaproteobacteria bacterium]
MSHLLRLKVLLASLLITACVTINVYFPAAAAERVADQIIDKVVGAQDESPKTTTPPQSSLNPLGESVLRVIASKLLDTVISPAHAQASANIDVSSPQIRSITASMQTRFTALAEFFDRGAIGLTADGRVAVRDNNLLNLPERARVRQLVAEDNRDRDALYSEIARANGHPEWEPDIRQIFARRWIDRGAKPGWYYQDRDGNWQQR